MSGGKSVIIGLYGHNKNEVGDINDPSFCKNDSKHRKLKSYGYGGKNAKLFCNSYIAKEYNMYSQKMRDGDVIKMKLDLLYRTLCTKPIIIGIFGGKGAMVPLNGSSSFCVYNKKM